MQGKEAANHATATFAKYDRSWQVGMLVSWDAQVRVSPVGPLYGSQPGGSVGAPVSLSYLHAMRGSQTP